MPCWRRKPVCSGNPGRNAFSRLDGGTDDHTQAQIDAVLQEDPGKITGDDNQLMPLQAGDRLFA